MGKVVWLVFKIIGGACWKKGLNPEKRNRTEGNTQEAAERSMSSVAFFSRPWETAASHVIS
tara:strand:- start:1238 stop:1420 length:183 start_codon:yes stop_codon:yes gene_type:complete